jgi:hypothetical protein
MFQEGHDLDDCETEWTVIHEDADGGEHHRVAADEDLTPEDEGTYHRILHLTVRHALPHPGIRHAVPEAAGEARVAGRRSLLTATGGTEEVPVLVLEDQSAGASGAGPAIVEGPFFTARVPEGWDYVFSETGDLILNDRA